MIDNRNQRMSIIGFGSPLWVVMANPDGSIIVTDRYQLLGLYSGLATPDYESMGWLDSAFTGKLRSRVTAKLNQDFTGKLDESLDNKLDSSEGGKLDESIRGE